MVGVQFEASVKYLLSLGNEVSAMKLGLENIRALLAALGDPQKKFTKVQVAGTNGKGSVCAFLDSICRTAGIKTGLYTSPHLISITERVKIGGVDISGEDFTRHASKVREASESLLAIGKLEYRPTFFEQVTAIALIAFAEAKVELAILETGLGGRLDATTAADAEIAAITSIDYDHQEYLGDTLAEIAAEKAAIIGPRSSVVVAPQTDEAAEVIVARCRAVGVSPVWASEKITVVGHHGHGPVMVGEIETDRHTYSHIVLKKMPGAHQFRNASVAIALAEMLRGRGFVITDEAIQLGLEAAEHFGRLEKIGRFLLDGAHNIAGARALRDFLDGFVRIPVTMVFGAMKNKDIGPILETLLPKADKLVLTTPQNERAMSADEITPFLPSTFDAENVFEVPSVEAALKTAGEITDKRSLVLVTGSLYLVGEARNLLTDND